MLDCISIFILLIDLSFYSAAFTSNKTM